MHAFLVGVLGAVTSAQAESLTVRIGVVSHVQAAGSVAAIVNSTRITAAIEKGAMVQLAVAGQGPSFWGPGVPPAFSSSGPYSSAMQYLSARFHFALPSDPDSGAAHMNVVQDPKVAFIDLVDDTGASISGIASYFNTCSSSYVSPQPGSPLFPATGGISRSSNTKCEIYFSPAVTQTSVQVPFPLPTGLMGSMKLLIRFSDRNGTLLNSKDFPFGVTTIP